MSPRSRALFSRAVVSICVVALAACGGGDDDTSTKANNDKASSQEVTVPGAKVKLNLASVDIQSAGPTATLDDKTKVAVMKQTRQYVEEAVVRPLLTGKKVKGAYKKLFGLAVIKPATSGPDRAALTDEGVGKVSGDVRAPATKVAMHALIGPDGVVQFIATRFEMRLKSRLDKAPLTINRNTELTFEPAQNGKWVVSAYRVITTRTSGSAKKSEARATSTTRTP
jgi:hypothetical protein